MDEEENIEPEFLKQSKTNPFRTPESYFETLEDRIMGNIEYQAKKKTSSGRIIQYLKPALGLVASFALVYILVYFPINILLEKNVAQTEATDSTASYLPDEYSLSLDLADENTLVNAIFSNEPNDAAELNPDEVLAYLSSRMNELEIYAEIQN